MDRVDGGASLWRRVVREYTASPDHLTTSGDSRRRSSVATSRIRVSSTRLATVECTFDLSDVSSRVAPASWTAQRQVSGLEEEREKGFRHERTREQDAMRHRTLHPLGSWAMLATCVAGQATATTVVNVGDGSTPTVAELGLTFSGTVNQPLQGAALKIQQGPAGMGGFLTGPFAAQQLTPPTNNQYALANAPIVGAYDPSFTFDFSIADEGNTSPNAFGDDIIIKYALFSTAPANGLLYRYAWRGVYDSDGETYTFSRAFDSTNGFAGSSYQGDWWEDPNADWGLVWDDTIDGTFESLNASVVPGSGLAALGTAGLAGLARRRRSAC